MTAGRLPDGARDRRAACRRSDPQRATCRSRARRSSQGRSADEPSSRHAAAWPPPAAVTQCRSRPRAPRTRGRAGRRRGRLRRCRCRQSAPRRAIPYDQHSHSWLPDEPRQADQRGRHADPAELLDHIEPVQRQARPQRRFVNAHDHRAAPVALRDVEPECLQGIGEAFRAGQGPHTCCGNSTRTAGRPARRSLRRAPRSRGRRSAPQASGEGSSQEQRGCRQQQHHHQVIAEAECVDGKEHRTAASLTPAASPTTSVR